MDYNLISHILTVAINILMKIEELRHKNTDLQILDALINLQKRLIEHDKLVEEFKKNIEQEVEKNDKNS